MIVGTAGHIDHGKTLLVKAITGIDADRLKEEKERGITIELGFAYWPQADGTVIGFVDVPGHERFVHTMLAGAHGIDRVLLVVHNEDARLMGRLGGGESHRGVSPSGLEWLAGNSILILVPAAPELRQER